MKQIQFNESGRTIQLVEHKKNVMLSLSRMLDGNLLFDAVWINKENAASIIHFLNQCYFRAKPPKRKFTDEHEAQVAALEQFLNKPMKPLKGLKP